MQKLSSIKIYAKPRAAGGNQEAKEVGEYQEHDTALTFAAQTVMNELFDFHKFDQSARDLWDIWMEKGTGIRIEPDDPKAPFNDVNFARLIVLQITLDYSHPLFFEVNCVDTLNFASGFSAPPRDWTFWVKAPATYQGDGVDGLMRRATEVIYADMSQKAMYADGSTYSLLDMTMREVSAEEAGAGMKQHVAPTLYFVQNDGSFSITPQAVPQ